MDHQSFDRLARVLGESGTRRSALAALVGVGAASAVGLTAGKQKGKRRKGRGVSAQAVDCSSLGHGANVSGCNFAGDDLSGLDLSSSRMVGTNFNRADLEDAILSASNLRDARFRGANLVGADLSSSNLRDADFRGFPDSGPNAGPVTDLTNADLHSSSGCGSIQTNGRTIICNTIWCDGTIRNDNCLS